MKSPRLQNLTIFRMGVLNSYQKWICWNIFERPLTGNRPRALGFKVC